MPHSFASACSTNGNRLGSTPRWGVGALSPLQCPGHNCFGAVLYPVWGRGDCGRCGRAHAAASNFRSPWQTLSLQT
eukprot:3855238-Prorocentrum_lima.AAC.1